MTNFMFIILIIIVIVAIVSFFNTPFGKQMLVKAKGRTDEIMRQDASTPEGARDYYNAAIRDKEEFYNKASTTFAEISGKLDSAEKELYQSNKEIMKITQQINACIDENNDEGAMSYAMKKTTIENKINVLKDTIEEMKQAKAHQKEIRDQAATDLQKLKEEKEQVLFQMEADNQIIELHQSMDSMNINNETERMLDRVREGARKTRERAEGSRIAYDTSSQAQDRRLEASERERNARQMIEEMKRQRGK
jgi:phage shock protein A